MQDIMFNWDLDKAKANQKKHGVTFEEAKTVFFDPNALIISDPDHSKEEERFILLGLSYIIRLLVVCHCYRKNGHIIRIISARKASKREQKQYWRRLA